MTDANDDVVPSVPVDAPVSFANQVDLSPDFPTRGGNNIDQQPHGI